MSRPRKSFHSLLCEVTGNTDNVYYQPPSNVHMKYPKESRDTLCRDTSCGHWTEADSIRCRYYQSPRIRENDKPYAITKHYQVTVIDARPENPWIDAISTSFQMCTFERHYTADGLNHDVFDIYY